MRAMEALAPRFRVCHASLVVLLAAACGAPESTRAPLDPMPRPAAPRPRGAPAGPHAATTTLEDRGRADLGRAQAAAPPSVAVAAVDAAPVESAAVDLARAVVAVDNFAGARSGSAFFVSQQGHLLTSRHVVERALSVELRWPDRSTAEARVVAVDGSGDLALLQVTTPIELAVLTLGDATELTVGDPVTAAGYPLGSGPLTQARGIVSAAPVHLSRAGPALIQIDAAVNPGSMGGPLLDAGGRVVAIVAGGSDHTENLNFAIPVNYAAGLPLPAAAPLASDQFAEFVDPDRRPTDGDGPLATVVRVRNARTGSQASGFFVSGEGHVLTVAPLVGGSSTIDVLFDDDTRAIASVVASSDTDGLALLKLEGFDGHPHAILGDATTVAASEAATVMGHGLGLAYPAATRGIVSAVPSYVEGIPWAILQLDAAVNPGAGGGPLVAADGRVIGIVAAGFGGAEGLNFAIPSNYASHLPLPAAKDLDTPTFRRWVESSGRWHDRDPDSDSSRLERALVHLGNPRLGTTGSGFFVSADGDILTCRHVVPDDATVEVLLADGSRDLATVVATIEKGDMALLRLGGSHDRPFLALGDATLLQPSAEVTAVGFPLGLPSVTRTAGIVSTVPTFIVAVPWALIQVDAAINPGNSGGPLLDGSGNVVGVVDAKVRTGEKLGFATPINYASMLPLAAAAALRNDVFDGWLRRADGGDGLALPEEEAPLPARVRIVALETGRQSLRVSVTLLDDRGRALQVAGGVDVRVAWTVRDPNRKELTEGTCDAYDRFKEGEYRILKGVPVIDLGVDCPGLATDEIRKIEVVVRADGVAGTDIFRRP